MVRPTPIPLFERRQMLNLMQESGTLPLILIPLVIKIN
jgi:hypothetical protein